MTKKTNQEKNAMAYLVKMYLREFDAITTQNKEQYEQAKKVYIANLQRSKEMNELLESLLDEETEEKDELEKVEEEEVQEQPKEEQEEKEAKPKKAKKSDDEW